MRGKNKDERISQRKYELKKHARERYLELMGINIDKVRTLEEEVESEYEGLYEQAREKLREAGLDVAEKHEASYDRSLRLLQKDLETKIARKAIDPSIVQGPYEPFPIHCYCLPFWTAGLHSTYDDVTLDPATGGTGTGSVNWKDSVAQPYADVRGGGPGTVNKATVTAGYKYTFTPSSDGTYCIRPYAYMNGHWLIWTWGTCEGVSHGSGKLHVKNRVKVYQVLSLLKEMEHTVVDFISTGPDDQSGFSYDSVTDGGAGVSVYLEGGHEAIVEVECECYVEISNHGRAWVDMQTSPHFYYKVNQLRWGPVWCWPIIWTKS